MDDVFIIHTGQKDIKVKCLKTIEIILFLFNISFISIIFFSQLCLKFWRYGPEIMHRIMLESNKNMFCKVIISKDKNTCVKLLNNYDNYFISKE